jgi:hypothetical protein
MSIFWLPLAFIFLAAPVLKNFSENTKVIKQGAILYGILLGAALVFRYAWESLNGVPVAFFILLFGAYFIKILEIKERTYIVLWSIPFLLLASFFINPESVNFAAAENLFSYSITSLVITVVVLGAACFILFDKNMSIAKRALILAAIAAVDLAVINYPFVQNVPSTQYYNPSHPAIQAIKRDNPNDIERPRIFSLTRQSSISGNIFPAYNMRHALGFHDNEIASYRAFKEQLQNSAMIDLMNVGYIIYDGERMGVEKNPGDLGRAKAYYNWETIGGQEEIIKKLRDSDFDYRNILLLENETSVQANDGIGAVKTVSDKMDKITFAVGSSAKGMLFISENFHKYWKAKVNGEDAKIYRAFSTFMAVDIPQGESVVELQYKSDSVKISLWIGLAGLALLLGVAVVLRFLP